MPGSSGGHRVRMPASGLLHVPPDPTALPLLPLLLSLCLSVCLPDRHQASALCRPLAMAFPFTVPQKSPEALPQAHTFPLELWTLPPLCSGTEKMLRPAGTLALPSPAWPSPSQAFLHGCPCAPCLLLCTRPVSRVSSLLSLGLTLAPWLHSSILCALPRPSLRIVRSTQHAPSPGVQPLTAQMAPSSLMTAPGQTESQVVPWKLARGRVQGQTRAEEAVKMSCVTKGTWSQDC